VKTLLYTKNNDLEGIQLSGLNLKTMKALNIREAFQQIYQTHTSEMFDKLLRKWYFWATHSRINPIKEAAYTIQRHWDGIVNWFDYKISNGILEGSTPCFRLLKRKPGVIEDMIPSKLSSICLLVNSTFLKSILIILPTQSDKEPHF